MRIVIGKLWFLSLLIMGCISSKQLAGLEYEKAFASDEVWVISKPIYIEGEHIVDKEVVILPGGSINCKDTAHIYFKRPVVILSRSRVFSTNLIVDYLPGVFEYLDIRWWGADGMDDEDDSGAIQQVFDLASRMGSEQIRIPAGRFLIRQQLRLTGRDSNHQSIVIQGSSISYDGQHGSTFLWDGEGGCSMVLILNTSLTSFEYIEFNSLSGKELTTNIEFRPSCNQISFRSCSFSGCTGERSCNINLNEGGSQQVSELTFDNCVFKGIYNSKEYTRNAVRGGLANTKNFYFKNCSLGPYQQEAIHITTSDILKVEDCTFYLNDVDILCETCKTVAIGNYSEESGAFFASTASANFNATTLINNQFTGKPVDGFVIRDGSGTLLLMNNNFGGGNYLQDENKIRWEENDFNCIYSVGNVYKNSSPGHSPFYNRSNQVYREDRVYSFGDLGGVLGEGRVKLRDSKN